MASNASADSGSGARTAKMLRFAFYASALRLVGGSVPPLLVWVAAPAVKHGRWANGDVHRAAVEIRQSATGVVSSDRIGSR